MLRNLKFILAFAIASTISVLAGIQTGNARTEESNSSENMELDQRIDSVAKNAKPSGKRELFAQWFNWNNWPNWGNWRNWANW